MVAPKANWRDPASAALGGGRFVLLGGLDAADTSSAGIELADRQGVLRTSSLPLAQHDAQAASLNGLVYVFGGGSLSEKALLSSLEIVRKEDEPATKEPQVRPGPYEIRRTFALTRIMRHRKKSFCPER